MAAATGNSTADLSSAAKVDKPLTLNQRIKLHDKVRDGTKCDLESPASLVANVNIKQLLTPAAFDSLPTHYQYELIRLLPEADRLQIGDQPNSLAMTVTALSNEFFAKSCVEYRDRLKNGEFTSSAASRTDIDHVTWECDPSILSRTLEETGVPKAGEPFIGTPKIPPAPKPAKTPKVTKKNKIKLQKTKPTVPAPTSAPMIKTPKKPVEPVKQEPKPKERTVQTHKAQVAGVKRPQSVLIRNQPATVTVPVVAAGSSAAAVTTTSETNAHVMKSPTIIRKVQKIVETNAAGNKVTKVVPVVVRNPNGQIVTTLADCNPLLTEMIKNNPQNCLTPTAVPVRVEKKRSLLPTILNRSNPVIVTLKQSNISANNGETVNKAVADVLSKIQSSQPHTNGSSQNKPIIVTVNNGTNGTKQIITSPAAINMERSRQICESSKPTLNLERSYQICKQVLGKSGSPTIVSVMVGPGGKKPTLFSKPVRSSRHVHQNEYSATSNHHNSSTSSLTAATMSDIALYKNKHRGKPAVSSMSAHVFLAMKPDDDGYSHKAYKRKTAFKQKPKKKNKAAATKTKASTSSTSTIASTSVTDSAIVTQTSSLVSNQDPTSATRQVTITTDTKHASEPVLSVSETQVKPEISDQPASTIINNNNNSLLISCMCSQRALVICQKCGAFNHAECMSKEQCIACLEAEH